MKLLHRTRLAHRERVAHETLAIRVQRPRDFVFRPGQYVDVTVLDMVERDALGPTRSLSIASAPGADHLEFVLRLRDTAYKRALDTMPIGAELLVEGPLDDLALTSDPVREQVFIAGGVGIAPFMSLLREVAAEKSELRATLFYSNRRPEDAAYLEELRRMEGAIPGFRLVATMTRLSESARGWSGETERIGISLLERYLPSLVGPAYVLVGSPTFISELRWALVDAGVPDEGIAIELFTGY